MAKRKMDKKNKQNKTKHQDVEAFFCHEKKDKHFYQL